MSVFIPSWISYRTYRTENEIKIAISNEKSREFLVLEDAAAILWEAISQETDGNLTKICAMQDLPLNEAETFVRQLCDIGVLSSSDQLAPEGGSWSGDSASQISHEDAVIVESEFQQWAQSNGFLWGASWETTYRCNEECLHCYNPGAARDHSLAPRRGTNELKKNEWLRMLQELYDTGVFESPR